MVMPTRRSATSSASPSAPTARWSTGTSGRTAATMPTSPTRGQRLQRRATRTAPRSGATATWPTAARRASAISRTRARSCGRPAQRRRCDRARQPGADHQRHRGWARTGPGSAAGTPQTCASTARTSSGPPTPWRPHAPAGVREPTELLRPARSSPTPPPSKPPPTGAPPSSRRWAPTRRIRCQDQLRTTLMSPCRPARTTPRSAWTTHPERGPQRCRRLANHDQRRPAI